MHLLAQGLRRWLWRAPSLAAALAVAAPICVVLALGLGKTHGNWSHLVETRLTTYATNSFVLAVGVLTVAFLVGVLTAWLTTAYRFPGRGIFAWALLLPLATPAYISAYALTDLLQFSGPLQSSLRDTFGSDIPDLLPIRSTGGAIVVLGLALYPYIYFAARAAFQSQSQSILEAARVLGRRPIGVLHSVSIPLARPSILAAGSLVIMETLADFGTVDYFAIDTLATGVYRVWYGLDSQAASARLATLLLALVLVAFVIERLAVSTNSFENPASTRQRKHVPKLRPATGALACLICLTPITIGFVVPAFRLAYLLLEPQGSSESVQTDVLRLAGNTSLVAGVSSLIAVILALVMVFTSRVFHQNIDRGLTHVSRAGYALPGPVLAIGLLTAIGFLDHQINMTGTWLASDRWDPKLLLSGSISILLLAYVVRFLAVPLAILDGSMRKVHSGIDDAAVVLSASRLRILTHVHTPMISVSLAIAFVLMFVEVTKELPATLMLRPFDFDTLAVQVYHLATEERLAEAAGPALLLVALGMAPVIVLGKLINTRANVPRSSQ